MPNLSTKTLKYTQNTKLKYQVPISKKTISESATKISIKGNPDSKEWIRKKEENKKD